MRNRVIIGLVLGGGALALLLVTAAAVVVTVLGGGDGDFASGERVQVIEIEGVLVDSRDVIEQLKQYEDSDSVPAVLLKINSPGGAVAPSQEIYAEILRLRQDKGKLVVAYMSSVGASGAYYIACAADRIIASPGTVVGSIGVIAEWLNYGGLLEWARVSTVTLTSGEFKDTPSPVREMTETERSYYQGLIDDIHGQFVEAVAAGRDMDVDEVRTFADGRVFTGREAGDLGMIDGTGNFQDAVDLTAEMAGLDGAPRLLERPRPRVSLLDALIGGVSVTPPWEASGAQSQIRFQYLWK